MPRSTHINNMKTILLLGLTTLTLSASPFKVGFLSINDSSFNTDKEYTGSEALYIQTNQYTLGYKIDVYTPAKPYHQLSAPPANQHPYAGYGYTYLTYAQNIHNFVSTFETQLGFTGAASNAQWLQDTIHNAIHIAKLAGWKSQVKQHFVVQEVMTTYYPVSLGFMHLVPSFGLNLGTIQLQENLAFSLYTGYYYQLPKAALSTKPFHFSSWITLKTQHTTYNTLLSGFENYPYGVTPNPLVDYFEIGAEVFYQYFGLKYTQTYTSATYKETLQGHAYEQLLFYLQF